MGCSSPSPASLLGTPVRCRCPPPPPPCPALPGPAPGESRSSRAALGAAGGRRGKQEAAGEGSARLSSARLRSAPSGAAHGGAQPPLDGAARG